MVGRCHCRLYGWSHLLLLRAFGITEKIAGEPVFTGISFKLYSIFFFVLSASVFESQAAYVWNNRKNKAAGELEFTGGFFIVYCIFFFLRPIYTFDSRFGPASMTSCGQPSAKSLKFSM